VRGVIVTCWTNHLRVDFRQLERARSIDGEKNVGMSGK
jgi:hypothetical protein